MLDIFRVNFVCVCVVVQALQFQRSLEEVEQCVASVERELTNEDCGSDLPSVNRLLKALQGLEEEVDGYRDRIQVHQHEKLLKRIFDLIWNQPVSNPHVIESYWKYFPCFIIKQGLMETAKTFHSERNFLAEEIQIKVSHTINRLNILYKNRVKS